MGDLNTMHEATMITTLFSVLATLCVTGPEGTKEDVTLCYAMPCCITSCHVMLSYVTFYDVITK